MGTGRVWLVAGVCVLLAVLSSGCVSQQKYDELKSQNRIQQDRIAKLESEVNDATLRLQQLQKEIEQSRGLSGADIDARNAEIAALKKDIEEKKALIEKMQAQLLHSGAPLPMELNVLLDDFAKSNSELVSFDQSTGSLKFRSDLLFDLGSDTVAAGAVESIKKFCQIMATEQGKKFDVIIAGHTDDVPIKKADTKVKHPTNWHLSVHRAISVLSLMGDSGVEPQRMSVRGFGEYRSLEPNKANKGGNAANRRVEIFIVPSGA